MKAKEGDKTERIKSDLDTHKTRKIQLLSQKIMMTFQDMLKKIQAFQDIFFICINLERWNLMFKIQIRIKHVAEVFAVDLTCGVIRPTKFTYLHQTYPGNYLI